MHETDREQGPDISELKSEIDNFEDIASRIKPDPGDVPELNGMDIYGALMPLNGKVGGDHIIYVDFNKRYDLDARIVEALQGERPEVAETLAKNRTRAGIMVADASGHKLTDAALAAMLHQAFLLGVLYELDTYGTVTTRLFENINTRFYHSSALNKYITMIYGEISENGRFRFINAGHPFPMVFSNRFGRLVEVARNYPTTFPPIGTMPSVDVVDSRNVSSPLGRKSGYIINDITLMGRGDILLLYTDGLLEHGESTAGKFGDLKLEAVLREYRDASAVDIVHTLKSAIREHGPQDDDISFVVVKRLYGD